MDVFRKELMSLLNAHNKDTEANTADYVLADFLIDSLEAFNKVMLLHRMHVQGSDTAEKYPANVEGSVEFKEVDISTDEVCNCSSCEAKRAKEPEDPYDGIAIIGCNCDDCVCMRKAQRKLIANSPTDMERAYMVLREEYPKGMKFILDEYKTQLNQCGYGEGTDELLTNGELVQAADYCLDLAIDPLLKANRWPVNCRPIIGDNIKKSNLNQLLAVAGVLYIAEDNRTGIPTHTNQVRKIANILELKSVSQKKLKKDSPSDILDLLLDRYQRPARTVASL